MKDYNYNNTKIKEINKLLDEAKNALGVLQRASRRVGKVSDYSITGLVGRNIVGNFLRANKNNTINKSIDRIQDVLLKLHTNLLTFDPKLASILDLPYKLSEFSSPRNALSDMKLRIDMRKKQFDIQKSEKKLITLIKKLSKEKSKEINKIKKSIELKSFED
ncbi:MAG: hypothetical protein E6073_06400 [Anaerococcus vaginalis]|nr:hypothetical protein [Anaerococcus vaginalis]MDU7164351.1 hypothetical protein [Anaerococcus vaginalis]